MDVLHALSELKGSAVIGWDKLDLRVGQSDRDAAVALLEFLDEYPEYGETTFGDAEGVLVGNFVSRLAEVAQDGQSWRDVLKDRRVRAALDCLWWFRFLQGICLAEDDETQSNGD